MQVRLRATSLHACKEIYASKKDIWEKQICAIGRSGEDSCSGDSGGGLIAVDRTSGHQIAKYLVGIVSYGPTPCGFPGWPGVYTRVTDYMDWIRESMESNEQSST